MKINLLSVGKRMPTWVETGFNEYHKRLPHDIQLNLIAVETVQRTKQQTNKALLMEKESEKLVAAIPKDNYTIALDRLGKSISTQQLTKKLTGWHDMNQDICLLIGGPEGISPRYLNQCREVWSLSPLTMPHPLVRVIVIEQIYRAWSIMGNHPYHR